MQQEICERTIDLVGFVTQKISRECSYIITGLVINIDQKFWIGSDKFLKNIFLELNNLSAFHSIGGEKNRIIIEQITQSYKIGLSI